MVRVHAVNAADRVLVLQAVGSSFVAVNGRAVSEQPVGRLCYGYWRSDDFSEDVVVCRTGEATVEISCHGGRAAVQRILDSLKSAGAVIDDWQVQQAVMTSAFEAELVDALSRGVTTRSAGILLDQASGLLRDALSGMLSLDSDRLANRLDQLLDWASFGLHLTRPWRVVLAGRPNAGKSTLINALLGYQRAIVFDQPGTTRDVVTGQTAIDGWPFQFADTAGIRATTDELEQAGIERAHRTVASADLLCLLLDISQPATEEDQQLLDQYGQGRPGQSDRRNGTAVIVVAHKVDLPNRWSTSLPEGVVAVSSTTGAGIDDLMDRIVNSLVPRVPPAGMPVPVSQRQVQWLMLAREALQRGDPEKSVASIRSCLDGVPFETASSSVGVNVQGQS